MAVIDPPHLETPVGYVQTTHPDSEDRPAAYNFVVRRHGGEPEAFIYVESTDRDDPSPLLRLTVDDAQSFIDALARSVLCVEVQNGVELPSDGATE